MKGEVHEYKYKIEIHYHLLRGELQFKSRFKKYSYRESNEHGGREASQHNFTLKNGNNS
jgi:hypothetical protein